MGGLGFEGLGKPKEGIPGRVSTWSHLCTAKTSETSKCLRLNDEKTQRDFVILHFGSCLNAVQAKTFTGSLGNE